MCHKYLYTLVFILLIGCVSAQEWTYTNQTTPRYAEITANGQFFDVLMTTITIVDEFNNTILNTTNMTKIGTGQYVYNFTPNQSGTYYNYYTYYNFTSDIIGQSGDTLSVFDNIPTKTTELFDMMIETLALFIVGILFLIVGYYTKFDLLILVSGVWFIINTISLQFQNQGWSFVLFFALVGIAIVYYYIMIKIEQATQRKQENFNAEYE